MKYFSESSYFSQISRARMIAKQSLRQYPLKVEQVRLVRHGENTTFRVISKRKEYLLRVHRAGYHSKQAIQEELKWLQVLSQKLPIDFQKPIRSKEGHLVVVQKSIDGSESRFCDLLEWRSGRIRYRSLGKVHFQEAGKLCGLLHGAAKGYQTRQRNYWVLKEMLGPQAQLGAIEALRVLVGSRKYRWLERCKKMLQREIRSYEKRSSSRISMIHADLHFGNLLWNKSSVLPIDFDDCGYGFQVYDLAVLVQSCIARSQRFKREDVRILIAEILEGYVLVQSLRKEDLGILPYFLILRRLVMFAWLFDRRGNPEVMRHLMATVDGEVEFFKRIATAGRVEMGLCLR